MAASDWHVYATFESAVDDAPILASSLSFALFSTETSQRLPRAQASGKIDVTDSSGNIDLGRVKLENLRAGSVAGDFIVIAPPGTPAANLAAVVTDVTNNPGACIAFVTAPVMKWAHAQCSMQCCEPPTGHISEKKQRSRLPLHQRAIYPIM